MSYPSSKGFEFKLGAVRDCASGVGSSEQNQLRRQAANLLTDRREPSASSGKTPDFGANGQSSLHKLELVSNDSGKGQDAAQSQGGLDQVTEAAAHRMSHSEAAMAQTDGDQAKTIMATSPTEAALKTLLDRDRSAAVDLAVQQPDVRSIALNSDINGTFQSEVKQRITGV
jgi:hypothetical protein